MEEINNFIRDRKYIFVLQCQPNVKFVGTYKNYVRSEKKFINVVGFFNGVMQSCQSPQSAFTFPSSLFTTFSFNETSKRFLLEGASEEDRQLSIELLSQTPTIIYEFFNVRRIALNNINPVSIPLPMTNILPFMRLLRNQRKEVNIRQYDNENTCLMRISNSEITIGRLHGIFFEGYLFYVPLYRNGYSHLYTVNASSSAGERYFLYDQTNPIFQRILNLVPAAPYPITSEEFRIEEERVVSDMENEMHDEQQRQDITDMREQREAEARRLGNPERPLTEAEQEDIRSERKRQFDEMEKTMKTTMEIQQKFQKTQPANQYEECFICKDLLDNDHGPDETNECTSSCFGGNSNCQPSCNNDVVVVCEFSHKFHRQCIINSCNRGAVDTSAQMGFEELSGTSFVEQEHKNKCPLCMTQLLYSCEEFAIVPRVPTESLTATSTTKIGGNCRRRRTRRRKTNKRKKTRKSKKKY